MDQKHRFAPRFEESHQTIHKYVVHCLGAPAMSILKHADAIENDIDLILREDSAQPIRAQRDERAFDSSASEPRPLRRTEPTGYRHYGEPFARKLPCGGLPDKT